MSQRVRRVCPFCGKIPDRYMRHLKAKHGVTVFNRRTKGIVVAELPDSRPKEKVSLPEILA